MSRIGKRGMKLPTGTNVTLKGHEVTVKGAKATLTHDFSKQKLVAISQADGEVKVERVDDSREARREQGLVRALINNMIVGVSEGFKKTLEIVGVGYRADVKGKSLTLNLGFSHPVDYPIPAGISISVDKQTTIHIDGADKTLVGETASKIIRYRAPEPYKGKGIKYAGQVIRRKAGKSAAGSKGG
ncbi:MAG: 50S ribosomal protein L6 [Deltaproteobacteria bacterium CG_4_10_14_0_2_um_filter_43_8]|nr:MAG: 50S ribosomal protein L6 [Deltaproteobacteria bacterium CG11_big_fil_rev_8_21_14_0_20_42_23]PJA21594.1 MAG: 50S ribosomal protein L6 [Deltaproteobacteria bacterium CG_4_10_14_0_2_um_filter_43_8]PJC64622.1 MAG: 50S ribosomal protein L6 [Deltaproteobacteria bacterium CG_4_9_14_0_2_um_filter_42_21]